MHDAWGCVRGSGNRPAPPTFRVPRQRDEADAVGAGAGAEHGHAGVVPAEGPRVLRHPAQRLDLVLEAVVAGGGGVARAQEACGARPGAGQATHATSRVCVGRTCDVIRVHT